MVSQIATLGGAAKNVKVGAIGHGLMGMTWTPKPAPDEQCFESIKAGIDSLPSGTKMLLNAGEFYAQDLGPGNLEMISRFFEKYPDYADKAVLCVKGGAKDHELVPDPSPQNLRRSVDASVAALRGKKRLDIFECARVVGDIEQTMKTLNELVKEGKFDYIALSECSAETVKKACKIAPVVSAEIEVSLWSYEEETRKVIATSKELGVSILAYSPVGRGMLTGAVTSRKDLPEGDMRLNLTRFSEENFENNLKLVDSVKDLATKRGVTPAQLAIAWVRSLGDHIIPIPGSSKKERTLENVEAGKVTLTDEDQKEISGLLAKVATDLKGGRYNDQMEKHFHLWG